MIDLQGFLLLSLLCFTTGL